MQSVLSKFKEAIDSRNRAALTEMLPLVMEENDIGEIFSQGVYPVLNTAREEFQNRRLGIPELLLSLDLVSTVLKAVSKDGDIPKRNKHIVLGVIEGDTHDMGKNIIRDLYRGYGFEVTDLGKNVKVSQFVDGAVSVNADLVGISTMMSTTLDRLGEVIQLLKEKIPGVKVIVGGAFINQKIADGLKADAYAEDAATLIETTDGLLA
ncbi:MAG: cobalamin-dependent protein [Desulfobacterium sp.]|nr:cobalamin-dependent protein [Desulfobacterium sp.]